MDARRPIESQAPPGTKSYLKVRLRGESFSWRTNNVGSVYFLERLVTGQRAIQVKSSQVLEYSSATANFLGQWGSPHNCWGARRCFLTAEDKAKGNRCQVLGASDNLLCYGTLAMPAKLPQVISCFATSSSHFPCHLSCRVEPWIIFMHRITSAASWTLRP